MPPSTPRSERTVLLDDLTVDVGPALPVEPPPSGAAPVAPAPGTPASGEPTGEDDATTSTSSPQDAEEQSPAEQSAAEQSPAEESAEAPAATSRRERRRAKREHRRSERAERRQAGGDAPMPGATQVVEAATAEQAISQVHQQLGAHAQILDAKLVRRGGFAGFFAREVVQLHVAPGEPASGSATAPADAGGAAAPSAGVDLADTGNVRRHWITGSDGSDALHGAASSNGRAPTGEPDTRSPVDRLLASDDLFDADAGDFATFLRRHLGDQADDAAAAGPAGPANGAVNGAANGSTNGSSNGAVNGAANGSANGSANGAVNGAANGSANGAANGSTTGSTNGSSTAAPAGDQQGPRTWAEYLQTRQGSVGAPVSWPQIDAEGCEVLRALPADPVSDGTPPTDTVKSAAAVVDAENEPTTTGPASAPDLREDTGDRPVDVQEHPADRAASGAQRRSGSVRRTPATAPREAGSAPCLDEGGVSWAAVGLVRLGLPRTFVDTVEVDEPYDDLAWTAALTGALGELCGPLPDRPSVMVGPLAPTVAEGAQVPAASSALWLRSLRAQRWVHLVVGGDGWRDWLDEEPLAVSWARPEDLPEAIRCAAELGLQLGFGPLGGTVRRAHPFDVALALRELVDER